MQRFRPATEADVDVILKMMRGYYAEAYCHELGVKALYLEVERHHERARARAVRAGRFRESRP